MTYQAHTTPEPLADAPRMLKVAELIGADLDAWVARAEGYEIEVRELAAMVWKDHGDRHRTFMGYIGGNVPAWFAPSTDPTQGQSIMERERIATEPEGHEGWKALIGDTFSTDFELRDHNWPMPGPTQLIAAMRCHVRAVYGDEVPA